MKNLYLLIFRFSQTSFSIQLILISWTKDGDLIQLKFKIHTCDLLTPDWDCGQAVKPDFHLCKPEGSSPLQLSVHWKADFLLL